MIPRSILISTVAVAVIYFAINLSIIGVVPWREFVPAAAQPESNFIVSIFMERIYGSRVATVFTLLMLWTAFGSVFALLLGYSRIPYAAAESGYFFRVFGRLHPTKGFPHVSLLVLGVISILAGFFSLGMVIDALIVTRILVQFMGQIVRPHAAAPAAPGMPRPYRMWLYPVPALVALVGWIFVFATTAVAVICVRRRRAGARRASRFSVMVMEHQALAVRPRGGELVMGSGGLGAGSACSRACCQESRARRAAACYTTVGRAVVGRSDSMAPRFPRRHISRSDWYRATTPSTVVGALVEDGVYRDPFFGMNLRSLPGMTYPIGANFVHTAMAPAKPVRGAVVVPHDVSGAGGDARPATSRSSSTGSTIARTSG